MAGETEVPLTFAHHIFCAQETDFPLCVAVSLVDFSSRRFLTRFSDRIYQWERNLFFFCGKKLMGNQKKKMIMFRPAGQAIRTPASYLEEAVAFKSQPVDRLL
jgi:hypothetical protein